jgi:hypothetical protein
MDKHTINSMVKLQESTGAKDRIIQKAKQTEVITSDYITQNIGTAMKYNNNNIIIQFNSILYYLCADSTATRPITTIIIMSVFVVFVTKSYKYFEGCRREAESTRTTHQSHLSTC